MISSSLYNPQFMRHSSVQIRGEAPDYQNYLCSCNNVVNIPDYVCDTTRSWRQPRLCAQLKKAAFKRVENSACKNVPY